MLKLYNSLSREIEEIKNDNGVVKMYSCGPTVYYFAHIGNMRAYLFMDQIRRVLKYNGLKINGVMNITDVGHLTSDADEGDDKMILAAKKENKTPWEIAQFYQDKFLLDAKKLNIDLPETIEKVTNHISDMIDFVKVLMEKGFAYEISDGIYLSVESFPEYGCLSRIPLEDKRAGARIEVNAEKKHPADFAIWIKAPENHIMQWQSPWGMGYPGWHIECSALANKYLGDTIHLHTGGIDHLPVHHENEIAQSNCYASKEVVQIWSHVAFLQVDGGKMSKSLGNVWTLDSLEERGYSALDYRFFNFSASYRKGVNFTWEALQSSKVSLAKMKAETLSHENGLTEISKETITDLQTRFLNAINDDLNFPLALSIAWESLRNFKPSHQIFELIKLFDNVLGLELCKKEVLEIGDELKTILAEREQARHDKNWVKSDELRKVVENFGFLIKDSKDSYELIKK